MSNDAIADVRAFNRFYTDVIGVLQEGLLDTPYTLTEARVVFELAQHDAVDVATLRKDLGLDAGYLSRILSGFETDGLITRERSRQDARRQVIALTDAGHAAFATLDRRSAEETERLLSTLDGSQRHDLLTAMGTIRRILGDPAKPGAVTLRRPRPGDLGWIIERHGALYAYEYGWDASFETLVARIVADFAERADPRREAAWVADLAGDRVGSVLCTRKSDTVAQLRLLLVEPSARGRGVGGQLIDACLAFAQAAGYTRIDLWTNDVLVDARRLYERAGFALVDQAPHHSFGHDLVEQTWSRPL